MLSKNYEIKILKAITIGYLGDSQIMWKLNSTLLHNQWMKEEITKETRKYFEMNENETQYIKNLRDNR